jgi:deazaflavin-dependent oxidoreductase (nitroreductase family)
MDSFAGSSDRIRAMYPGGRADATARRLARIWAALFSAGLMPRRWVTLEVRGRRSGRPRRFPLGMARLDGRWYLISMLGERCNWVQNVRAAHGLVTLRHGRAMRCQLQELPVRERPLVLKRYLQQVPGARPHFPVSQHSGVSAFEEIAGRYPVFLVRPDARRTRRHLWRWILAALIAIVVIITGAVAAFIKLGPTFAPLALPQGRVSSPSGPLAGTWQVAAGSLAGFRVQETALGFSNYVGGQTRAVSGAIVITGHTITSARFRVNLTAVTVNGKIQPQFANSLGTHGHPLATVSLTRPVTLSPVFAAGRRTVRAIATGQLTMNGSSRPVTVTLTARRNGPELQAAGSIPVQFARWGVRQPAGFGPFGALADSGDAEFLLILHRE